jgi:hypothetical protein
MYWPDQIVAMLLLSFAVATPCFRPGTSNLWPASFGTYRGSVIQRD